MFLANIEVSDFRNYRNASLTLSEGVNIFVGNNAQGKTNLLEAVYLLSIGKSARTPREKEMIREGQAFARVSANIKKLYGCDSVTVILSKNQNKKISINGLSLNKTGELMGCLKTVFFSPDELKVIKDGPQERRRFMDIAISQLSKNYFYTLNRYNKALSHRNKLLKSGNATAALLDIWDSQLCREGARIIRTRRGFINRLEQCAIKTHSFLTDNSEKISIVYQSIDSDLSEIESQFLKSLQKSRERDVATGFTNVGAQKDDFLIKCNDIDVRSFGSQGQQRTAALSLKLAELEIFKQESGEYPVLLLDDVLSELDDLRRAKLIKSLDGIQTIITCTSIDDQLKKHLQNMSIFRIERGSVV